MTDSLPTVWHAEPHTLAKHAILQRYLEAWFPILSHQVAAISSSSRRTLDSEILFIDGFAGPGEYTNGKDGSPVIALKATLHHSISFPIPVRMLFIEVRQDRFQHLQTVLAPYRASAARSSNIRLVEPRPGDCDAVLNAVLDECERQGTRFGPALAFLDQFGYGAVSMTLISRILSYAQCEVFTYLDYKDMHRFIADPAKAPAFTRAYGGDEWRGAMGLPENERRKYLLEQYKAALKDPKRGKARYVTSFSMFDKDGQPLYWLIFCTNNLRGLEEMKRAMWAVDSTGEFRFSDQDNPSQLKLFSEAFDDDWLADELATRLAGRTMKVSGIKEHVLTDTPCCLYRPALKLLEMANPRRVTVTKAPAGRRAGTYPDDQLDQIELTFERELFGN